MKSMVVHSSLIISLVVIAFLSWGFLAPAQVSAQTCDWVSISSQGGNMCEFAEPFPNICEPSIANTTVEGHFTYGGACNQTYKCVCSPAPVVCTEPNGPYDNAWCQARGYNYSTSTCSGLCANCSAPQIWDTNTNSCVTPIVCTEPNGPYNNAWCQTRGYDYSTNTCNGFCANCPSGQSWNGTSCETSCVANMGNACVSPANNCGMTQSNGTIACNGTCTSTPPANVNYDNAWCQARGYDVSTNTCLGLCACTAPRVWDSAQSRCVTPVTACTEPNGPYNNAWCQARGYDVSTNTCSGFCACTAPRVWDSASSRCVSGSSSTPTLTFSANPTTIPLGGSSTLSWTTTGNVTACWGWGGGIDGWKVVNGSQIVSPVVTTDYFMECWNSTGTSTGQKQATVAVSPLAPPTLTFVANPYTVVSGGTTTLTWATTNAQSCRATNGITGWTNTWQATNSSGLPKTITTTTTFTLECFSGLTGTGLSSGQKSVTINVNNSCAPNCSRASQVCSGQSFDNGCGSSTCQGTRTCNFNWVEVAP